MRKIILFLGLFLLAGPVAVLYASDFSGKQTAAPRIILVGHKSGTTVMDGQQVTVYVEYNPNLDLIMDVWAYDLVGNPVTVNGYSGDISNVGSTIYATNFQVNLLQSYVVLNGAFTM